MTNRANVKVLHESQTGLNDRLSINGVTYTNNQAYNAAIQGKIDGYHGVNNNGTKFLRSNPDKSKRNNLD